MKSLKELREGSKMSQRQFAKIIGLSYGAVAMYESGARTPSLNTAKVIGRYFNIPVEEIYFGKNANDVIAKKAGKTA